MARAAEAALARQRFVSSASSAETVGCQRVRGRARIISARAARIRTPPMNRTHRSRQAAANSWLVPPASVRQMTWRWLGSTGSWASAASKTLTWSVAVLEPALPGRSSPASASPVASRQAGSG